VNIFKIYYYKFLKSFIYIF